MRLFVHLKIDVQKCTLRLRSPCQDLPKKALGSGPRHWGAHGYFFLDDSSITSISAKRESSFWFPFAHRRRTAFSLG